MTTITKERLEGELVDSVGRIRAGDDAEVVEEVGGIGVVQNQCCGNCGTDLSGYVDESKPKWYPSRGIHECAECPSCGWDPNWKSGPIEDSDAFVIVECKRCKQPNVQRERRQLHEFWLSGPNEARRTKKVLRRFGLHDVCGACREKNQAAVHYRSYQRAVERWNEKRESQKRGVARFLAAEAKKKADR